MVDRAHQGAVQTVYIRGVAAHLRGKKRLDAFEAAANVLRHYDDSELQSKLPEEVYVKMWQPSVAKAMEQSGGSATHEQASNPPGDAPATPVRSSSSASNASQQVQAKQLSPTTLIEPAPAPMRSPIVAPNTPSSAFSMPSPIACPMPYTPPMPRYGPPSPFLEGFYGLNGAECPPPLPPPVFRPEDTFRHSPVILPQSADDLGALPPLGDSVMTMVFSDLVGGGKR